MTIVRTEKTRNSPLPARRKGLGAVVFALVLALFAAGSPLVASAEELPTTGTISGTVTTPDGQPIEGASISKAFSGLFTSTDANGYFELADVEFGVFDINAYRAGYQYAPSQQGEISAESPTASLTFVLTPFPVGTGSISGVVTVDGTPLAGKDIGAYEQSSGQNVFTTSDESGYFELAGLADGVWRVFSYSPEYQPVYPEAVTLSAANPTAVVNVPFLSWPVGTSSIVGVLSDGGTGEPIPGGYVSLQGVDVAHQSSVSTDETGAFRFEALPSGTYSIQTFLPGYLAPVTLVEVAADEEVTVDLVLLPTNSTISGRITGPNGVPAEGIFIEAVGVETGSIGSAVTDADGNYAITNLGPIDYILSAGGAGTPFVAQQKTVTAVANDDLTVNFSLKKRKTGTLGGWILNPDGSYHPEAACVTLYSAKTKKAVATTITAGEEFGGDGTYSFIDVKPGTYTVKVRDCDGDPATKYKRLYLGDVKKFKNATFVTIVAGQDSYENNITLVPRGN